MSGEAEVGMMSYVCLHGIRQPELQDLDAGWSVHLCLHVQ